MTWYKFLKAHADNEDAGLFPAIEELLDDDKVFEESEKEHGMLMIRDYGQKEAEYAKWGFVCIEEFRPGLARFQEYLVNLSSSANFSGTILLEIMETF